MNWRRWAVTVEAVASVLKAREALSEHRVTVWVVDNEAGAEPAPALPAGVHVVPVRENLGYAGGNNLGARLAVARYPDTNAFLILNNDARIEAGALRRLLAALEHDPGLGVAAPVLVGPDGRVESAGGRFGWRRVWWADYAPEHRVDFVSGAALVVRRMAWDAVGGFDTRYFHYVEDMDFGYRLKQEGWGLAVVGDARVLHLKSRSPTVPGMLAYYTVRNQILFWRKTRDPRVLGIDTVGRLIRFLMPGRQVLRGDARRFHAAWDGLFDGLRGATGPSDRWRGQGNPAPRDLGSA